jgi:hypothetical protein
MVEPPHAMTFGDGYVLDAQTICIASRTEEELDYDTSLISVIKGDQWASAQYDDIAVSVACLEQERVAFFLGYNGKVFKVHLPERGRGPRTTELIPVTEELGHVLRIRNIAGVIFVCGMSGQVYRRRGSTWSPIDEGIRGIEGLDFEDIGGTGDNDLYAVASSGDAYHFDGRRWEKLDFPSNRPLSGVRCIHSDEVYVCGNDGNLFRGKLNQWEFIGDPGIDDNFWAVEKFGNTVFVAYDDGLFAHDGSGLNKVRFRVRGEVDGYRLHANDGVLWSFGEEHLLRFDGLAWHRVV